MNAKTVTLLALLIVLLGGGVGLWLFSGSGEQGTNTTPSFGNNTTLPGQTSVGIDTPPESLATLDFEGKYEALLAELGAQKAPFVTVRAPATTGEGSVYALYAEQIADSKKYNPQATDFSIQVALEDLNEDGAKDAIVYAPLPGACGTAGCPLDIYERKANKWTLVFSTLADGEVGLGNTIRMEHVDLYLTVRTGVRYPTVVARYSWNGETYEEAEPVASWANTHFIKR